MWSKVNDKPEGTDTGVKNWIKNIWDSKEQTHCTKVMLFNTNVKSWHWLTDEAVTPSRQPKVQSSFSVLDSWPRMAVSSSEFSQLIIRSPFFIISTHDLLIGEHFSVASKTEAQNSLNLQTLGVMDNGVDYHYQHLSKEDLPVEEETKWRCWIAIYSTSLPSTSSLRIPKESRRWRGGYVGIDSWRQKSKDLGHS